MSDDEKDVYYASLIRRADRLNKLLSIKTLSHKVPPGIVALHLKLLMVAGLGYCGEQVRELIIGWLDGRVREHYGLCKWCGTAKDQVDDPMCKQCEAECAQMDFEAEEPKGGVS